MRKTCGQAVVSAVLACAEKAHLHTTNVFLFLVVVRNYRQKAPVSTRRLQLVVHSVFTDFTEVTSRLIPIIHTTYKDNNKVILNIFHSYRGAAL
ncbi:MAG: hypothetical protein JWO41_152 [Candidatus Saccharibacteria bacterium]|nr:hypothetical protein [Candidatus Saccharibacteria bacterium]